MCLLPTGSEKILRASPLCLQESVLGLLKSLKIRALSTFLSAEPVKYPAPEVARWWEPETGSDEDILVIPRATGGKKVNGFPVPRRDVTYQTLPGRNN